MRCRPRVAALLEHLKVYLSLCDRLIAHGRSCPACQGTQPCQEWGTLHREYEEAASKAELLGVGRL